MKRSHYVAVMLILSAVHIAAADDRPNIVFVLFDDMGWGQPQSYAAESALRTPNFDRLVSQGMRFTDAHTAAAVCTPTRYGLLTGRYPSRIGQFGVLTTFLQAHHSDGAADGCLIAQTTRLQHFLHRQVAPRYELGGWQARIGKSIADRGQNDRRPERNRV